MPKASGTWPSATAAAEPEDEPPGVCAALCGLVVGPGWRLANSVVTVLPRMTALAVRQSATQAASPNGTLPCEDRRVVAGRHVVGVDDVLHAHRHAAQHAAFRRVGRPGLRQREVGIEIGPRLHGGLALGDALEAGAHQRLRGERAGLDPGDGFAGAERLHASALRTQAAMFSRRRVLMLTADELDTDGQAGRTLGEGQGHAGHPEIGPQKIEGGLARGLQAERRLARRRRGQDGVEVGEQRIDPRAAGLAQLAGGDPGRVVDLRSRRELVLLQALAQQVREAPRLVGMGARTVEGAERLLALGHVAHRRRQLELGDRRTRLGELDGGVLHRRQALGRKLRLVMGEADGDARRLVELARSARRASPSARRGTGRCPRRCARRRRSCRAIRCWPSCRRRRNGRSSACSPRRRRRRRAGSPSRRSACRCPASPGSRRPRRPSRTRSRPACARDCAGSWSDPG